MFWQNLVNLCVKKGTNPTALMHELDLAHGNVTRWKNGSTPRGTTLKKIADYFDVPPEYLIREQTEQSGSDTPEVVKSAIKEDTATIAKLLAMGQFNEKECLVIAAYRNRPDMQPIVDKLLDLPL